MKEFHAMSAVVVTKKPINIIPEKKYRVPNGGA